MNEVAIKYVDDETSEPNGKKHDFSLSEIPNSSGGRRFIIKNPEKGLPQEAVDAIRNARAHYVNLFEQTQDVGIKAKCEAVSGERIRVFQRNLQRPYFFRADNGAYVE